MPLPGDVDVVLASELMEGGRAIQRGLVTPDRTTLLASTHRVYSIAEKSALGDGRVDSEALLAHAATAAKRFVRFDMAAVAEQNGSVIGAVLFGALAGTGVLPFGRAQFEATIERGGVGVGSSLKAFAAAYRPGPGRHGRRARAGGRAAARRHRGAAGGGRARRHDRCAARGAGDDAAGDGRRAGRAARSRASGHCSSGSGAAFPPPRKPMLKEGVRRLIDYQDPAYAGLYLDRLAKIAALAGGDRRLLDETARHLALWMTYEDTIRVAALKTRGSRFERVRHEVRAGSDQVLAIDEYLHPGVREIAETLAGGDRPRGRAAGVAAAHGRALHPPRPDRHHQLARRLPPAAHGRGHEALAPLDHALRRRERGDRVLAGAASPSPPRPIRRWRSRWRSASAWSRATATPTSAACATSRR